MAAEILLGGAVGAAMGEIMKGAIQNIQNGRQFGPTLEMNAETLNALAPLVEEMKGFNYVLNRPIEEIERFEKHIREGKELERKGKMLTRWKFLWYSHYQTKLKKKDEDLLRYLAVNMQVENRRDVMEMLAKVNGIYELIIGKEGLSGNQIWGLNGNQFGGLWGVPGEFVGMEEPLNNLKIEMMKDGVSVHVLNGLGGSGQNTLAKKLCWDSQIKGKFGGNIFFITISATSDLKNIVQQTLFEHCGLWVPEFHNDEDAINRLGLLLKKVGKNPILLVLDNVCPGSESLVESLVEKLQIQMQDLVDCKILVTSTADAFTRFGTPCELYPLQHDHAVSLFLHFAQLNHSSSYMPDNDLLNEVLMDMS
ncbi:unnamed protein product [Trifolium pratense]|uniref:Uncharacterized protein n=1 Tax=Trifolium pratense TaxID=57577 RepID=A0ACB0JRL6_TRIPR|nr:unnamed protein product [Trifolium pratense]